MSTFHDYAVLCIMVRGEQGTRLRGSARQLPSLRADMEGGRAPSESFLGESWSHLVVLTAGLFSEKHLVPQRSDPSSRRMGDGDQLPVPFLQGFT